MKRVVILGSGGFAREACSFLQRSDSHQVVGFVSRPPQGNDISRLGGIPILGDDEILGELRGKGITCAFVAVGDVHLRSVLFGKIRDCGLEPINIVHPTAYIAPEVTMGGGVIVYPNASINTGVHIGDSVLINSNVSIGHDVRIGNYVNINPGSNIAGYVEIGDLAFLGIGCAVLEKVSIGSSAVVGGGALVRRNVLPGTKVVGVPAREIPSGPHKP